MAASNDVAPVIIKRKKVVKGDGHHGGAWKVAYADFVTAMMAFFMLMWLLNATTEKQRKGIADYFSPSIPISRVSGGGDGAFGGDSVFSQKVLPQNGTGAERNKPSTARQARGVTGVDRTGAERAETEKLQQIERALTGRSGESMVSDGVLRHIVTRVTDEGLIIEIAAREGAPLFEHGRDRALPVLRDILRTVAKVTNRVENPLAIGAHVPANPLVLRENPVWSLSAARAGRVREWLETSGTDPARIQRVTGFADRKPVAPEPMSPRNDRVEIIVLRDALPAQGHRH
jgi:chemotaxis protein MotB